MSLVLPTFSGFAQPATGGAFTNEYSVDFDGADDYMGVTPSSSIDLYGISMWFNCDTTIDNGTIRGILFGPDASTNWFLGLGGNFSGYLVDELISINKGERYGYGSSSATIATGWHHVAAVWSTSSATNSGANGYDIYLDGVKVGNIYDTRGGSAPTPALYTLASGAEFRIGQRGNATYPFAGKIDEVAIFDSTVSSSDITAIYNSGVPADLASLRPVGWWRMGDGTEAGSGTTIYDMSSNSNNGTLTHGPTYSTDTP